MGRMKTAAVVLCVVAALSSVARAGILLTGSTLEARAYDSVGGFGDHGLISSSPTNLPFAAADSVTRFNSANATSYDFDDARLMVGVSHVKAAGVYSYTWSVGWVQFVATTATPYALHGSYQANDVDGLPNILELTVTLRDLTDEAAVFHNFQRSKATLNESFVVGGLGGDDVLDHLEGDISGVLEAGHSYELHYRFFNESEGGAATSAGTVTMLVPEPASIVLLLAPSCCWRRRRPRRRGSRPT